MPVYLAKPPSPRLQFGHRLASRRVGIWPMAEVGGTLLREAGGGTPLTLAGGTPGAGMPDGPGVRFLTSQYASAPVAGSAIAPGLSARLTVHLRARLDADTAGAGLFSWADSPLSGSPWLLLQVLSGGAVRWLVGDAYRATATAGIGESRDFTLTYDGVTWTSYLGGAAYDAAAGGIGGTQAAATSLYLNAGYPDYPSATHSALAIWDRCLSPSAVAALAADPHAPVRPRRSLATLAAAIAMPKRYVVIRRV